MITFKLNARSGVPIYRQIQDQIRYGIAAGFLSPGEQLPTVRGLAVELEVNPNTVIKAYSELEREGVLVSEQGSGTFIGLSPPMALPPDERQAKLRGLCSEFLAQAARLGFSAEDLIGAIQSLTRETA
ncbi:MAG TPA: GntR family transcriptional regulator, partial [Gemmataceae bacterium]|nr:GntR family transcriptional regulator [Gemmataceae bacterium]